MRNDITPGFKGDEAIRLRIRANSLINRVEKKADDLRALDGTEVDENPVKDEVTVRDYPLDSARWTPWGPTQEYSGRAKFTEDGNLEDLFLRDKSLNFTYRYSSPKEGPEIYAAPVDRSERTIGQVFSELNGNGITHDGMVIDSAGVFRFLP